MDPKLLKDFNVRLTRVDEKLSRVLQQQRKETWVKVSWIVDLTGWSREKLRQARNHGIITYRKTEQRGIEYLLESVPEPFIIKKQTA